MQETNNPKVANATMENEAGIQKIRDSLKKRNLNLSDNEIESVAQNLYELGLFLVRIKIKKHSGLSKPENVDRAPPK